MADGWFKSNSSPSNYGWSPFFNMPHMKSRWSVLLDPPIPTSPNHSGPTWRLRGIFEAKVAKCSTRGQHCIDPRRLRIVARDHVATWLARDGPKNGKVSPWGPSKEPVFPIKHGQKIVSPKYMICILAYFWRYLEGLGPLSTPKPSGFSIFTVSIQVL